MHCSDAGSSCPSGTGILDPVRIEDGQVLVMRISAVLAPWRDFASPSVWKGKYLSFERPTVIFGSSKPPRLTRRIPSEVLVVDRLPRK